VLAGQVPPLNHSNLKYNNAGTLFPAAQIRCNPTNRRGIAGTFNSFVANDEVASPILLARGRSRSLAVATIESIDATRGVNQLLLAGEKRMASRTNFYVQIALLGRTCLKTFAARASYRDFAIFRMNSSFHFAITYC